VANLHRSRIVFASRLGVSVYVLVRGVLHSSGARRAFILLRCQPNHEPTTLKAGTRMTTAHEELPKDLTELTAAIHALPEAQRAAIEPLLERVSDSTRRRRRILNLVQEALSQLRLDMKYLMFDLEATRRERDAYRKESGDE